MKYRGFLNWRCNVHYDGHHGLIWELWCPICNACYEVIFIYCGWWFQPVGNQVFGHIKPSDYYNPPSH